MKLTDRQRDVLTRMSEGWTLKYNKIKGAWLRHGEDINFLNLNTFNSLTVQGYVAQFTFTPVTSGDFTRYYYLTEKGNEALCQK